MKRPAAARSARQARLGAIQLSDLARTGIKAWYQSTGALRGEPRLRLARLRPFDRPVDVSRCFCSSPHRRRAVPMAGLDPGLRRDGHGEQRVHTCESSVRRPIGEEGQLLKGKNRVCPALPGAAAGTRQFLRVCRPWRRALDQAREVRFGLDGRYQAEQGARFPAIQPPGEPEPARPWRRRI